jgi:hypothetical protein
MSEGTEYQIKVISVQSDDTPRRVRVKREAASLRLAISVPEEGEECCIGMEPIADYRMEWLPSTVAPCLIEREPLMTKATIVECGHGFNALALLCHFAMNEMTCPCCRRGHSRKRMSLQSVPPHIRGLLEQQLAKAKREEQAEQLASDAQFVQGLLEREVPPPSMFLRFVQASLILYAYAGADSMAPLLAQEIRLESSLLERVLRLSSCTYSVREICRNMRMLSTPLTNFELVAAIRQTNGEMVELARSQRFELVEGENTVPCSSSSVSLVVHALSNNNRGERGFERVVLTMPSSVLNQFIHPNGGSGAGVF